MINPEDFCGPSETIDGIEDNSTDCITYIVAKPGRGINDRVLLDVPEKPTTPCVITGGNSFTLETLQGFGRLTLTDLTTGAVEHVFLEPGVNREIPIGVAYQYANCGGENSQLLIRDTSLDFDLADETTVEALVHSLSSEERY